MEIENKVASVDEFLKVILSKTVNSPNYNEAFNLFWFRGESSEDFKTSLVPNAYRALVNAVKLKGIDDLLYSETIKSIEQNVKAEFHRKALPYIISRKIEDNDWNRYFLMQHYKIQTRLLDWTESALLALFFAILDNNRSDAKVWILKPFDLNNYTIQSIFPSEKDCYLIPPTNVHRAQDIKNKEGKLLNKGELLNELTRRYLQMDFNREDTRDSNIYYPLAISPSFLDQRMSAQKSCFTIFGNKINGLHTMECKEILDYILIDWKRKEDILNELRIIGVDFSSIYPDLDGLGNSIASKFKQEYENKDEVELFNAKLKGLIKYVD